MKRLRSRHRSLRDGAIAAIALLAATLSGAQQPPPAPPASPAAAAQAPAPSPGTGSEVTLEIRPGAESQLKLAAPSFKVRGVLSGAARQAATQLEQTVRTDLQKTGIFVIQGPAELAAAKLNGDQAHDFE